MNKKISPQTLKAMKKILLILIVLLGNLGLIQAQSHFNPVWSGNGLDQMNFYIMTSTINGNPLEINDEVGIYDDGYCVGAGVYTGSYDIDIKASRDDIDVEGIDGYTVGHSYYFKIWDASEGVEISDVVYTFRGGSKTFNISASAYVNLTGTVACTAPAPPTISTITQPGCSNATGTVELMGLPASGTWTLTRSPGNIKTNGEGPATTISDLSEGDYTWTVTNSSACTSASSESVTIEEQPSTPTEPVVGTITQPTCNVATGSVVLSGLPSGTWTLTMSPGGVETSGSGTSKTISGLDKGAYTWTVTNNKECTSESSDEAEIDDPPSRPSAPTVSSTTQPTCDIATGVVELIDLPASGTWTLTRMPGGVETSGSGTGKTISDLGEGTYTWTVTSAGCTSASSSQAQIFKGPTKPRQPSAITGNGSPCAGSSGLKYSVTNGTDEEYSWTVPSGWTITNGQGSNEITVTAGSAGGNINVTPSNDCGDGPTRSRTVSISAIPEQPGNITGNDNPCEGASGLNYSVSAVSGVEYYWVLPSGWTVTNGQGTNSVTVTAGSSSGNIKVSPSNSCGEGEDQILSVTTSPKPDQPSLITGDVNPCEGSNNLNYSVTSVADVDYHWTVPSGWTIKSGQGSGTVTVSAGSSSGNITVTPSNSCGNGVARSLSVNPDLLPEQPEAIEGNTTVCRGASLTYSIDPVDNADSYTWVLPSGWTGTSSTTSITAVAGESGEISVRANNGCGTGTARAMNITVNTTPETPDEISGSLSVCQNTTQLYSVTEAEGATSYIWTIPSGWTGSSSTKSISVTAGNTGGSISVAAKNACGTSSSITENITTIARPSSPTIGEITDLTCTEEGSIVLNSLPSTDSWTITQLPGGKTYSGSGSSYTVEDLSAGTYTFKVANASGCSSVESASAIVNESGDAPTKPVLGNIKQPTCDVSTGSVTLTGLPATGTWTLTKYPGGSTFTGTGTSKTLSGLTASTTYNFSVTSEEGCISSKSNDLVIQAAPLIPEAPTIEDITDAECGVSGSVLLSDLPSGNWTIYELSDGSTTSGSGSEFLVEDLGPGTYSFTITNESECTSPESEDAVVHQGPEIPETPVIGNIVQPTCLSPKGSIVLNGLPANGSWTLRVSPGGTTTSGTGSSATLNNIAVGTYTYTVTNEEGCTSEETSDISITQPDEAPEVPVVDKVIQPTCILATGSIGLKNLPLSGEWTLTRYPGSIIISGNVAETLIAQLPAGEYSFMVTNALGCNSDETEKITINAQPLTPPAPVIGTITQPDCAVATGSIELTGLPEGTWELKGSSGDKDTVGTGTGSAIVISLLPKGIYTFEATNSAGCVSAVSENATIEDQPETPQAPEITLIDNVLHSNAENGNQWYTLEGPVDGATSQNYTVAVSGDYYAVVSNGNCTSEPSDTLQVTITGLLQTELAQVVRVYPNPVKHELNIKVENGKTITRFEITNSIGQTVYSGELLQQTVVHTRGFRPGVYLIRFTSDTDHYYVKIVKD